MASTSQRDGDDDSSESRRTDSRIFVYFQVSCSNHQHPHQSSHTFLAIENLKCKPLCCTY